MQEIKITIINWEKYNPSHMQVNAPHWFRIENSINRSESLCGLSKIDKWHWICLLGVASRKKSGSFVCDLRWLSVELMLRPRQILQLLDNFFGKNLLHFELKSAKKPEVKPQVNPLLQYKTIQYNTDPSSKEGPPPSTPLDPPKESLERTNIVRAHDSEETASPPVAIAPDYGKQVSYLIGVYVKSWQARYGTKARPDVGGKAQGVLKRLVKDSSMQQLGIMLEAYCQMTDDWFKKKHHDLVTFENNLNKVALALDKGVDDPLNKSWWEIVQETEKLKTESCKVLQMPQFSTEMGQG